MSGVLSTAGAMSCDTYVMGRARKVAAATGFFVAGAAISVLVVFLKHEGLERASLWAGLLVLFLTIAIAVSGVWVAWLSVMTLRETRSSHEAPGSAQPLGTPVNTEIADQANRDRERSSPKRGSTFHVRAKRDAYAAQEMTVINLPHDDRSGPGVSQ
jgi:hypothetical protein